jgi:hypothetical protein
MHNGYFLPEGSLMDDAGKKAKQLKLLRILSVILGILLALIFLAAAGLNSGSAAVLMFIGAILVLPLTWFLVGKLTHKRAPNGALLGAGIVVFAIGVSMANGDNQAAAVAQGFANVDDYKAAKALKLDAGGYAKHKAAADAACRDDLKCWAEQNEKNAAGRCIAAIEGSAKYDYDWMSGAMPRFAQYAWVNKKTGVVSYRGDQIKLQNGFGVFSQHRYSCSYDPAKGAVTDVAIVQGKLL